MEVIIGVILLVGAYMAGQEPKDTTNDDMKQCMIACSEGSMKQYLACKCKEGE